MTDEKQNRNTYKGDAAQIADALLPLATQRGPPFCKYGDESTNSSDAKVIAAEVENEHELLNNLKKIQSNLSFSKKKMEAGVAIVQAKYFHNWKLKGKDAEDHITTMSCRIRALCRVVSQAELKSGRVRPAWIDQMPWRAQAAEDAEVEEPPEEDEGNEEEEQSEEEDKEHTEDEVGVIATIASSEEEEEEAATATVAAATVKTKKDKSKKKVNRAAMRKPSAARESSKPDAHDKFVITFSEELNVAIKTTLPSGKQEPSYPIEVKGDSKSEVIAFWPNGESHVVPGLTAKNALLPKGKQKGEGILWEGTQDGTNHKITLKQRVDTKLLLSLFEQKAQRLSINLDVFGLIQDQHKQLKCDDPIVVKGMELMKPIAEKFKNTQLGRTELKTERNKIMVIAGLMEGNRQISVTDSAPRTARKWKGLAASKKEELPAASEKDKFNQEQLNQVTSKPQTTIAASPKKKMKRPTSASSTTPRDIIQEFRFLEAPPPPGDDIQARWNSMFE
jgi:hypothetical protein